MWAAQALLTERRPLASTGCPSDSRSIPRYLPTLLGQLSARHGTFSRVPFLSNGRLRGGDRADRGSDRRVEDGEGRELGGDPELLDRGFSERTMLHPRASFFFAELRAFAGAAGWNTSK